jgi:hypothetical protein
MKTNPNQTYNIAFSGSQTLFGNPPSRNSVSLMLSHAGDVGAKQSFADIVPKQSLGTREARERGERNPSSLAV